MIVFACIHLYISKSYIFEAPYRVDARSLKHMQYNAYELYHKYHLIFESGPLDISGHQKNAMKIRISFYPPFSPEAPPLLFIYH